MRLGTGTQNFELCHWSSDETGKSTIQSGSSTIDLVMKLGTLLESGNSTIDLVMKLGMWYEIGNSTNESGSSTIDLVMKQLHILAVVIISFEIGNHYQTLYNS